MTGQTRLRASWMASPLPAVIVPEVIGTALAAEVRGRLEQEGYTRYGLVDRGSYDFIDGPSLSDLHEVLAGIASEVTGRRLTPSSARALRLGAGDYLLVRHDRVHEGQERPERPETESRPIELVLDLSAAPTPGAEVHWRHRGQVYFMMPSSPGALAIVERGPTVMCNHTYVSKIHSGACAQSVIRLVLLASASAP